MYITSKEKIIITSEMENCGRKLLILNLRYFPGIFFKGRKKIITNLHNTKKVSYPLDGDLPL